MEMYEIKKGKPYYYPLLTLTYTYNIPRNFEDSYLKCFSIKYTVIMLIRFFSECVMPMLHLIMSMKDKTGVDITEDLTVSIGEFGCILAVLTFTLQYKKWTEFFNEITIIPHHPCINFEKFVWNVSRFAVMYICYAFFGVTLYGMASLSESSQCKQLNEEKGLHESCYAYHTAWFPFDTTDIFSAAIIFTLQAFVVLQLLCSGAMICFIVLESTEILILHMDILKANFISLFEETSNQEISAKFRFCVIYHNHILRLGKSFNNLQKFTTGHISFIAALAFGCVLNQIQNTKPIGAILYLLGLLTAVGIACHSGQRILDQTSSISDAVYASNWDKADPQMMKDLAFVILRCQTPLYLSCIPLGVYNYALFVTILKTSYSYLTILDGAT